MVSRVEHISKEQLEKIQRIVGEAFVSNELFHNWGSEDERREYVMKYMALYRVYRTGRFWKCTQTPSSKNAFQNADKYQILEIKEPFGICKTDRLL